MVVEVLVRVLIKTNYYIYGKPTRCQSRSLVAIKADNPILVNPIGVFLLSNDEYNRSYNHASNCINFYNSTQPVYWDGCLKAEVSVGTTDKINIETIGMLVLVVVSMSSSEFHIPIC